MEDRRVIEKLHAQRSRQSLLGAVPFCRQNVAGADIL